jgi:UDP-N-acetylglucosamine 2-epimerase (non-hydrolysing)
MSRLRVLLVFGTRPEAIKMAPLVAECRRRSDSIETIVCVTGQHRRLLDQVIDYFGIPVDLDLRLMRPDQSLAEIASRCLQGLDAALVTYQPGCVIAQGDTTTAMAAALAAFYRRIPLVHVEAGLRTGNLHAPWPEEFNRRAADLLALLHCAPSRRAADNLLAEGVPPERVHVTGNTVIDALLWTVAKERAPDAPWREKYAALGRRRMVLVTAHRRENLGEGMRQICRAVAVLADRFPDVEFVYPVHPNPNVRRPAKRLLAGRTRIHLVRPTPYGEFVWLMDRATLILTDSGGVQEEAVSLHKPVLVLRETTERGEALEAGAAELVGTNVERIVARASTLLLDWRTDAARRMAANPYGDGKAAARIVDLVLRQGWHRRMLPICSGLARSA